MKGNFEGMICGTKFRCEISFLCVLPREVSDIYLLGIVTSSKYGHQRQVRIPANLDIYLTGLWET